MIQNVQDEMQRRDIVKSIMEKTRCTENEEIIGSLEEILKKRVNVFSTNKFDLGITNVIEHIIDIGDCI